jgi:adenosylmethionine-8-amino-7-oxononanoate aminotransferase
VTLEHAYHGDTVGTMSAGQRGVFNAPYEPLLFDVERLPFPARGGEQRTVDAFEAICKREPGGAPPGAADSSVSALGLRPDALAGLKRICEAHGVLLMRTR